MSYIIVAILIALYYFFAAPKSIKNTMNMILIIGIVAILLVLSILGFAKLLQSPPEVFLGIVMIGLGFFTLRDVLLLSPKPNKHAEYFSRSYRFIRNYFKSKDDHSKK